jgi:hypothetical protein
MMFKTSLTHQSLFGGSRACHRNSEIGSRLEPAQMWCALQMTEVIAVDKSGNPIGCKELLWMRARH